MPSQDEKKKEEISASFGQLFLGLILGTLISLTLNITFRPKGGGV